MFFNITKRLKLLFCKDRELYVFYYNLLGFYPNDISYYEEAFTHRSATIKNEKGVHINNERLEFLGDAILDAMVADVLYKHFRKNREGFLTNTRAKIVQRENLNKVGLKLGLDKVMKTTNLSQSHNSYLYGNAVEALIGAIYLDRGYKKCKQFAINNIIGHDLDKMVHKEINYKSRLIEWAQKNKVPTDFSLISTEVDSNHNPVFKTAIILGGIFAADGVGYTKKESHQIAAKKAYHRLHREPLFLEQILTTEAIE